MADHGMDLSGLVNAVLNAAGIADKAIEEAKSHAEQAVDDVADHIEAKAKSTGKKVGKTLGDNIASEASKQKNEILDAIIDVEAAKKRIKELQVIMKDAAKNIKKLQGKASLSSNDYKVRTSYETSLRISQQEIEKITAELKAQGVVVRNTNKEYKELQDALEEIGFITRKTKKQQADVSKTTENLGRAAEQASSAATKGAQAATRAVEQQGDATDDVIKKTKQLAAEQKKLQDLNKSNSNSTKIEDQGKELAKFAQEQGQVINDLINYTSENAEEVTKIVARFCNKIQNESMSAAEAIKDFTLAIKEYGKAAGVLKNNDNVISVPTVQKKSSKIKLREFTQEEYDARNEKYQQDHDGEIENLYETVDILRQASQFGTKFSADLMTSCKKATTAVKRFFSAIDPKKYPALNDWKEEILESVQNGVFSGKDMYNGMFTGQYSWGVEAPDEDSYYVYLNLLDVAKDKEEEYSAYIEEEYRKRDEGLEKQAELIERLIQTYEKLNKLHANEPNWDKNNEIESIKQRLKYYEQEKVLLQDIQDLKEEFKAIPAPYTNSEEFNDTLRSYQHTLKLGDYGNKSLSDNERVTSIYQNDLEKAIQKQKQLTAASEKAAKAIEQEAEAVEKVQESYRSISDIMSTSSKKYIGRDWEHEIYSAKDSKQVEGILKDIDNQIQILEKDAHKARLEFDMLSTAIQAYTGDNLSKKIDLQKAIKDAWRSNEKEMAAKLFARYQERFPDGKFNPDKVFGGEWTNNFSKNLEAANRSLSIWRSGIRAAAEEYGKFIAYRELTKGHNPNNSTMGYRYMAQLRMKELQREENEVLESQRKQKLLEQQAHSRFDVTDKVIAYKNLCEIVDEYNKSLETTNQLIEQREKFTDSDIEPDAMKEFEQLNADGKYENLASYLMAISREIGKAIDYTNELKIGLTHALRVYRELGGTETPNLDKSLLNEIDVPVKSITETTEIADSSQQEQLTAAIQETVEAREQEAAATKKVADARLKLAPKSNYEKLFNTLVSGDNAYETKSKGDVSGFSWADRETIAETIIQGLQQGLNEINIVLNNGKTTLTIAGGIENAAKMLDLLGFKAIESEITKFIGRVFKNGSRVMYQSSEEKGNYIASDMQLFKLSRPLNESEYGRFESYQEKDFSVLLKNVGNATANIPANVREALVDIPGDKKGKQEKHYIFKTEDGQYLVLKKSAFDNIRKVSSNIMYDPKAFKNGIYNSLVYGFGEDGNVVSAMVSRIMGMQQIVEKLFDASPSAKTDFSLPNKNILNIAGVKAVTEKAKILSDSGKNSQSSSFDGMAESAERAAESNKKLESSYKGLAEAVEQYVESSKKLWAAYDNGEDFSKFAEERNAAIEKIASLFPADNISGIPASLSQSGYKMFLQSKEMSSQFAKDGAEATLKAIETSLGQATEEVRLAEEAKRIEEERLAEEAETKQIADEAAETKRKQAEAAKEVTEQIQAQAEAESAVADAASKIVNSLNDANSASDVSVEELIKRDIDKALAQLRSAKDNKTTLIDLNGVFDGDDLIKQARSMVDKIAEQANLSVGKFDIDGKTIKVRLYNEELKITVNQMYKLRDATKEASSAQLELTRQSFSQNVKALNENNFDVEGTRKKALTEIDKVKGSLQELKYDLTDLETAAKAISSQDDFTKFNNQLKAAQNNIQAIKNSTVSKSSMNPLANMQRDMKNAGIEIDTMRLKLEGLGDVKGIAEAKSMLSDMTAAVKEYNAAQDAQSQQKAYNQYSNLRSSFEAQLKYINEAKKQQEKINKAWKDEFQNNYKYTGGKTADDQTTLDSMSDFYKQQEEKANQFNDNIRSIYDRLVATVKEINSLDTKMNSLSLQDKGSGFYAKSISSLQDRKGELVADLRSLTDEINNALSLDPLSEESGLSQFFKDARVQAALTSEEIQKFDNLLRESNEIEFNFGAKLTAQIQPVIERIASLKKMIADGSIDKNSDIAKNVLSIDSNIEAKLKNFTKNPTAFNAMEVMNYVKAISTYIETLDKASQKEAQYFAGKQKYTQDTSMQSMADDAKKAAEEIGTAQQKLTDAAQKFAQESGTSNAIVTNFAQGADGISRLDFSVFDTATNSLRNFRMEMGSVTDGMHVTETTVSKSLASIQAAQKQLQSANNLLVKLGASDVNISGNGVPTQIQKLLESKNKLSEAINKGDQSKIIELTSRLKMALSELEKLYKQMIQMQDAIDSGKAKNQGAGDPTGDVYSQLVNKAKELAAEQKNATLEIGNFDEKTNTLTVSLTKANGMVETFKFQMSALNGQMSSQQVGVSKLSTAWDQLKASMSRTGKQLMTALVGYNVFFKAISEVRKGISYVKEIDLAMTELKKVTDETEESYKQFLNTAASTAGEIGSTVSDFTEASANFARLGYSMEESAEMAKTAIVYKNVADGLDTVEESTDSIISTMKAFGIESSDTMGIIDRFNEVKVTCLLIW